MRSTVGIGISDKIEMQRAIKKLEAQRDDLTLSKYERKKAVRREIEDLLDKIQASLRATPELTPLFIIR